MLLTKYICLEIAFLYTPISSCNFFVTDFGLAQYLHSDSEASSLRGSPLYMAPEILLKHHYDASVDLWSVGIILYGKQ